jgi:hypothetical protein
MTFRYESDQRQTDDAFTDVTDHLHEMVARPRRTAFATSRLVVVID